MTSMTELKFTLSLGILLLTFAFGFVLLIEPMILLSNQVKRWRKK